MKSKLQEKMVEDMQLRGYAKRTQTTYARAVRLLENYESLLRHYLLRKLSALRFGAPSGGGDLRAAGARLFSLLQERGGLERLDRLYAGPAPVLIPANNITV